MFTTGQKIVFLLLACACCTMPVLAGTKYMAGSPELSAYVSGTNEFNPGDTVQLTIVIQNTGLNEFKFVQSGIVDREDLPNTAKFLQVTLQPGNAPVIIKTDPQMIGDLKGASSASAVFTTKIDKNAAPGTYLLRLSLNYTYLYQADQFGVDTIQYYYKKKTDNLTLPVRIKSEVTIEVVSAIPEHLNVGTEGYITMKIKNTGFESGKKAVVKIIRNDNSPVIPVDNSVFLGDFVPGDVADCRYKVSVSNEADRQTYPVDVVVEYRNNEGDTVTSRSDTVGIPVGGKIEFEILSPPATMFPGTKKVISMVFKNSGDSPVYSAQARISAVDPFTSNDDVTYLGDLKPGESATASFDLSVDRAATMKEYGLDSEIRYRDALDNTYISDTMKVKIMVTAQEGFTVFFGNPVYLSVMIAVVIGIIYIVVYSIRKKRAR